MKSRIVEAGLWLVAAACAFWSALWVAGVNGFAQIGYGDLPGWLQPVMPYRSTLQWAARPTVAVRLGSDDFNGVFDKFVQLNGYPDSHGHVPARWGEILPGASVVQVQDPSHAQRIGYVVLQIAVFAAVAFIAITLARLVADSRGDSPFRLVNVRRLQRIGVLLLVGAPVASSTQWAWERWMVESSSVGDRVTTYGYRWSSLPLWTMLVGAAVLVLADVWRRGVRMAEDVRGLV